MFQLENLETIRSKYEGMSRGHVHVGGKLDPKFFKSVQLHPPPHRPLGENIDRSVSVHHSLVPFGTPRAIP